MTASLQNARVRYLKDMLTLLWLACTSHESSGAQSRHNQWVLASPHILHHRPPSTLSGRWTFSASA